MTLKNRTLQRTFFNGIKFFAVLLVFATLFSACEEENIFGTGEIADKTPPTSDFSYEPVSDSAYLMIRFSDLSNSNTKTAWNFGDGNTSEDKNPTHTYADEGDYTVTLTSSDNLNVSDVSSQIVEVKNPFFCPDLNLFVGAACDDGDPDTVDDAIVVGCVCMGVDPGFVPMLTNPSFDIEDPDDYREGWRNGDLGGVIQITGDPIHTAPKAAKLPSDGSRIGYQLVTVEPNVDHTVTFYYTMKTGTGTFNVSILGGDVTDPVDVAGATIASVDLTDQNDPDTYVMESVSFNSGSNTEIAIFFSNTGVECRIDTFTIEED